MVRQFRYTIHVAGPAAFIHLAITTRFPGRSMAHGLSPFQPCFSRTRCLGPFSCCRTHFCHRRPASKCGRLARKLAHQAPGRHACSTSPPDVHCWTCQALPRRSKGRVLPHDLAGRPLASGPGGGRQPPAVTPQQAQPPIMR